MEVTVLIENYVSRAGLTAEHGLSFCIDTGEQKILFDTGASHFYAQNAQHLGCNSSKVSSLIISHGHNDHTGGLAHFLEFNHLAPIYLKKEAFWPKFKYERSIGINPHINAALPRFKYLNQVSEIADGVYVFPETQIYFENDRHRQHFYTEKEQQLIDDEFADELFMVLKTNAGVTLLSSCSHNGITNMLETAENYFQEPISQIVGGFHLKDEPFEASRHLIDYFNGKSIKQIYTGHCTGLEKFNEIQTKCQCRVYYLETGKRIIL